MDPGAAPVPLSALNGAPAPPTAPRASLFIRARLSSDDYDDASPLSSDAAISGDEVEEEELEEEEEYATASDPDEAAALGSAPPPAAPVAYNAGVLGFPRSASMPKAQLTVDDDSASDASRSDDDDVDGFSDVARVLISDQNPVLGGESDALVSAGDDVPSETPASAAADDMLDAKPKPEGGGVVTEGELSLQDDKDDKGENVVAESEEAAGSGTKGEVKSKTVGGDESIGAEVEEGEVNVSSNTEEGLAEPMKANYSDVDEVEANTLYGVDSIQNDKDNEETGDKTTPGLEHTIADIDVYVSELDQGAIDVSGATNEDVPVQDSQSTPPEISENSVIERDEISFSGTTDENVTAVEKGCTAIPVQDSQSMPPEISEDSVIGDEVAFTGTADENATAFEKASTSIPDQDIQCIPPETSENNVIELDETFRCSEVYGGGNSQSQYTDPEPELGRGNGDHHSDNSEGNLSSSEGETESLASNEPPSLSRFETSEYVRQMIKALEEGSFNSSDVSARKLVGVDGQIVFESDEDVEREEVDEEEVLDSSSSVELSSSVTYGSTNSSLQGANKVILVDHPAGLGSSVASLKPAPISSARTNLFVPSDVAIEAMPDDDITDEEIKLHNKVESIRVKFLRLVHRLGHSPEETVAAQVLYRLSLAEGIRRGRRTYRTSILESSKKKALQLEADGEGLDFFCSILVLGKSGVGKSATINSIFDEEKLETNAFEPSTASVREMVGSVAGVKVRVIDTPGLRASVMDQASNRQILASIRKHTKKHPPDIVLYVDRVDCRTPDLNDLPLLKTISSSLGPSIWLKTTIALTHAASAPPDGPSGSPLSYEMFVAQRSHVIQQSIRLASGDMRLMNPVALVENHQSCRRNRKGQRVLPNGLTWRTNMLLLCFSSKILSEANSLLKLQDSSPAKLFGFRLRSPPLPFLLSSLLQSRQHPKLPADQGYVTGASDIDLDDLSDTEEHEDDEYNQLPPFRSLRKYQINKLTKEQRMAYFDEYDYRVKLLQKKQWKDEVRRLKEMKRRKSMQQDDSVYGDMPEEFDQDAAPATVPVPMPDMALPPSFDCDTPSYRYRFLEPTSQLLARPVLHAHGWDHDCGYDGVSVDESLVFAGRFPAALSGQITKDKKEFSIHLDSSVSTKHGENGSSLLGFDIQTIGKKLGYILLGETKFKNLKKNKTAGGISITLLGETVATGCKFEDELPVGKRVNLAASVGAVRAQGETAYGANLEARLKDKDYPIVQALTTLGFSLMSWHGDLALGANLQSQFDLDRNWKMAVRIGLNNKKTGQISIRTSTSEQLQLAVIGIVPIVISIFRSMISGEPFTS